MVSPSFQEMYDRITPTKGLGYRVKDIPIFEKRVEEFDDWINQKRKTGHLTVSDEQIKNLAEVSKEEGVTPSLPYLVRYETGARVVYRDVLTGKFATNPNKEIKEE